MAEGRLEISRLDGFLKLEEEIEKLRLNRQKRQMTIERREKRDHRSKARKYDARHDRDSDE